MRSVFKLTILYSGWDFTEASDVWINACDSLDESKFYIIQSKTTFKLLQSMKLIYHTINQDTIQARYICNCVNLKSWGEDHKSPDQWL